MGDFWETENAVQRMAYDTLNGEIKRTMRRSARDMVQIGCLLKTMMDKMMWQEYYSCFDDYLRSELQMDYTMATRFMKATEKYSVRGNSMEIEEKYEGYSQAVLIEMLNMPPELEEKVTPGMTVKQVREVKRQARQKEDSKNSDTVIDGDYREIDTPEQESTALEEVATSQPDDPGEAHDERWFVEQYVKFEPKESEELMEICLREKNNSDRAKAIQMHIAPYGCNGTHCSEFDFVFHGFTSGIDLCVGEEKIHMTYRSFSKELSGIAEQEAMEPQPARSAYGLEKTEYPEGSLIAEAGCGHKYNCFSCAQDCSIRGKNRYCKLAPLGNPFDCEMMGILEKGNLEKGAGDRCQFVNNELAYHKAGSGEASPCCRECKEICEYRCQRSVQDETEEEGESEVLQEAAEPEADAETKDDFEPLDELSEVRRILEQEKKLLHDYFEVGDIPERTVFRQKTIVAALAAMICDLEDAKEQEEQAEQPELPDMANDKSRKAFIDAYEQWPVWIDIKETGERYYRYRFPNGRSFVVKVYLCRCFDYKSSAKELKDRYHDSWRPEEYYIFLEGKHFRDCRTNRSTMIEFLKEFQK